MKYTRFILILVIALFLCTEDEPIEPEITFLPVIDLPVQGTYVTTPTITVSGHAEQSDSVAASVDDLREFITATTEENGEFTIFDFPVGGHGGRVLWVRDAEDTTLVGEPIGIHVDIGGDNTPEIVFPPPGSSLPGETIDVMGLAPDGMTTVELYVDDALAATVPVTDGAFVWDGLTPVGAGYIRISARGMDNSGSYTAFGDEIRLNVGTGATRCVSDIISPVQNEWISSSNPVLSGHAVSNSTLRAFINGGMIRTPPTWNDDTFEFSSLSTLSEGTFVLAIASDQGDYRIAERAGFVHIDQTSPEAPVIFFPRNNATVRDSHLNISGSAEPWSRCILSVNETLHDTVDVETTGMFTSTILLTEPGEISLSAIAADRAKNQSVQSIPVTCLYDPSAPERPTIDTPESNDLIVDSLLSVTGTCSPEVYVGLYVDHNRAAQTVTDLEGNYLFSIPAPRPDGTHNIQVRATKDTDSGWVFGDSLIVSVDLESPAAPIISVPPDSSLVSEREVTVRGSAEPRASVELFESDIFSGQTVALIDGSWETVITLTRDLEWHHLTASQTDTAGHISPIQPGIYLMLDETEPQINDLSPASGSIHTSNPVVLSGSTEPDTDIWVNGMELPTDEGRFSTPVMLAEGWDTVHIEVRDPAGNGNEILHPLRLDTTTPFITVTDPPDSSGTSQTSIVLTGNTEPGSNLTIQAAFVPVGTDGSFQATISLNHGWNEIRLVAIDEAGWSDSLALYAASDRVPGTPSELSPESDDIVLCGMPLLSAQAAQDPDADFLTYEFRVYDSANLTTCVAYVDNLPADSRNVEWIMAPEMPLNGSLYHWRIRAYDGTLYGPWSDSESFRIADAGPNDPHELFGYGDSITAGAQGIPAPDGENTIWIWMSAGYIEELEFALSTYLSNTVQVDYEYVPGGSSQMGLDEITDTLTGVDAAYVLLLFGTIDANASVPPEIVISNLSEMIDIIYDNQMIPLLGTIPPRIPPEECGYGYASPEANDRVIELNNAIRTFAEQNSISLADHYSALYTTAMQMGPPVGEHENDSYLFNVLSEDGIHPNGIGYSVMAREWFAVITGSNGSGIFEDLLTIDPGPDRITPDMIPFDSRTMRPKE